MKIECRICHGDHPTELAHPDNCVICRGGRGGVKGNENIVDNIVMCDYCSVTIGTYKELMGGLVVDAIEWRVIKEALIFWLTGEDVNALPHILALLDRMKITPEELSGEPHK